jgi:hypothetical protein
MSDVKEVRQALGKCQRRVLDVERRLLVDHKDVLDEKRHLVSGAEESGYYVAGYLAALREVMVLLDSGEFPVRTP